MFSFSRWLKKVRSELFGARTRKRQRQYRRFLPQLECLENRILPAPPAPLVPDFHVITTADNGNDANPVQGSLRDGIKRANGRFPPPYVIDFEIGDAPQTIVLQAPLPEITRDGVMIIGDSLDHFGNFAKQTIRLDAGNNNQNREGISVSGSNFRLEGIRFDGFQVAVHLKGGAGDLIQRNAIDRFNVIGIELDLVTKSTIRNNEIANCNKFGVLLNLSTKNTIDRNTVSSSRDCGIALNNRSDSNWIDGNTVISNNIGGIRLDDSQENKIHGNAVGVTSFGFAAGNTDVGIRIQSRANNNYLWENVICANGLGVEVTDSSGVRISDNGIGIGRDIRTGTLSRVQDPLGKSLGNLTDGVVIRTTDANGRATEDMLRSNVIANNQRDGVVIRGVFGGPSGNWIVFNNIGTFNDPESGESVNAGNGRYGVYIGDNASGNHIKADIIAFNSGAGAEISKHAGVGNLISDPNSIYSNGGLGIDINEDEVPLPNDPGDADTGANNQQNYPLFTASPSGSNVHIVGSMDGQPNNDQYPLTLEFFANPAPDPSGYGEGQYYVGTLVLNAPGDFTVDFPSVPNAPYLSATATDAAGNTSEFSPDVQVSTPSGNLPPIAIDDFAGTKAGNPCTIPVLANDFDPNGDALTVTTVGTPAHGTAVINANNTVTFTPTTGTTATSDTFSYAISDGHGGIASATVSVALFSGNQPPTAVDDPVNAHGAAVTIAVVANDWDLDGDPLTVVTVGSPSHGTAVLNGNNTVTYTPTSGVTAATDQFTYSITDGNGAYSTATVFVNLPDRSPVAVDDFASTHGSAVTIAVLQNDSDPDADRLTVTAVGTPAHGTAVINANNTVTYTPNSGVTAATDSFTYTISDGFGGSATATVHIQLSNRPRVASDDNASTHNSAVTVNVLKNDYDPDSDSLTVTAVGTPAHGTAVINGNNTVTYTPTSGVTAATDGFTYSISDGYGGTATASVVVYLADRPPVAEDDTVSTHYTSVTIDVLGNDSDPDGDTLTVTTVGTPGHGTAVINTDNTVTYTPTSGTTVATDGFTYTVSDGHGGTATASVVVYLANRAPVAGDDSASTHSAAVTVNVLGNDYDPDGDTLTVTAVGTPAHGTAVINGNNTVTYTPTSGVTAATDAFTYTVSDGHGATTTASVVIYLTDRPPVAGDDSASTHSAAVTIGVLDNDTDPDGDALTVTTVGTPAHGTAVINADNTVTYTPTSGTTAATDGFTYVVSDGYGGTASASVLVYLADRPPVAQDDNASTHGAAVTISVLANDSDPDGDRLTVTTVSTPAHGTAVINADNTVTYTPTSGTTVATDSFTYTVSDGNGGAATATVVIYLANRAPVASDDNASTHTAAVTVNVLANDSDPDGDRLTVTTVSTPGHGTAVINADNTVTYTPTSGTTVATDSFTYTVDDGNGGSATATVVIYLANRPPVARDDNASTHAAAVTINVLANDSDPDGDRLTVTTVSTPAHGTAVINADNTVTYTPTSGTTVATDGFTYTVSDGNGATSTASVVIYLANRAPVATDDKASTHTAAVIVDVLGNDYDPDGDRLTVTTVSTPAHGTAVINADNTVTYTPTSGTTVATDGFTYTVSDGHGGTTTASVVIYLANRAPVANDDSASTHTAAVTVNVLGNDYDPDGDRLTVTTVSTPAHGTAVINADNTVTYTPTSGTTVATDSFTYTVSDGNGGATTATVVVYLADRAPIAGADSASTHSAAVTIDVLANDYDADGDRLTVTTVSTPGHGTAVINADNTVTYTPTSGTTAATDSFTYTVSDGQGGSTTATVTVQLANRAPVANPVSAVAITTAPVTINVLGGDYDPDGDKLTVTAIGTPTQGTAVLNADNTITYTRSNMAMGTTDTFSYTIADGHSGTATATVTVYILDRAPTANPDSASPHGQPVIIDVLANDSDPDGDPLTVTVGTPGHGTAVLNADNTVTYTPTTGTTATTDSFTYTISDGQGFASNATATVSIFLADQAPTAAADSASPHGNPVIIDVLANDADPDGDRLTVTSVSTPGHGTAVINADNTVTYTPTSGTTASTDSFTYTIADGQGGSATATVSVYLTNRAPAAVNDVAAWHGIALTLAVLANDADPDGDKLTVTTVSTPAHGTAVLNADNTVTYTPTSGTTATTDTFTYTIADGYSGTATATVEVYLTNPGPIANQVNGFASTTPVTLVLLANDYNPDGDAVSVTAIGTPSHGSATLNADGTITYTPPGGFFNGTDSFTYTIADGYGGSATATIVVTVTNPSSQPVIAMDVYGTTVENKPEALNLVANDYSSNGYGLTVTAVGSAAHGTVSINADGTIEYTPTTGTTDTTDFFTYTISDGHGNTATATVYLSLRH